MKSDSKTDFYSYKNGKMYSTFVKNASIKG